MNRIARVRGFTLLELLVAMALMVILTTMLASFVGNAQKIYNSAINQAQVISNARTALQIMGRDLSNIASTIVTSTLPVPDTENFSPSGQESTAALVLRSPGYVPEESWRDAGAEISWPGYAESQPPVALVNETTVRDRAFLQFFATTRFYNAAALPEPRFEQQMVLVQYYLRRRPQQEGYDMPGSLLMRRIQPYKVMLDSDGALNWDGWADPPVESDICSFVRGVRVYYYDRDREVVESNEDVRYIEAVPPTRADATSPPPETSDPEMWDPNIQAVTFWIPNDWSSWLNPTLAAAPTTPDFDKKMFLPPSIMINLLVCSSDGRTFREVKEVFHLPAAPDQVPINPFK